MNTINNNLKWLLFAFLSLFLVACKPTANFIYSPSAPSTGEVVKFDASKSSVYKANEGNAIAEYSWDFGDGAKATGQTVEHSFQKAGKYTVQLNVTDLAGQTSTTSQKITVKQSTTINKKIAVLVETTSGSTLSNATVSIHGQKVNTDEYGQAELELTVPTGQTKVVAQFEKLGYITQAIEYDLNNLNAVSARLIEIKQVIPVQNIENAQTIDSLYLGASITISENSFAYADGRLATGTVSVEFTPWDIQGLDLQAMPANGTALDAEGNRAQLISAGMISATFKDANGEKLQLVAGKTADIQMDLPLKSINNQKMEIGTQIPMWHFEESKGLWVEEGLGQVVASSKSSTGLAVHAKVSHFSTWNWDFKLNNPGSVFVQCQSAGSNVPCHLSAKVTLQDQSKYTYSNSIGNTGVTVINMPNQGSIEWSATDLSGTLIGETISGTTGNVIIDLGEPTTNNFVSCVLPNGEKISCSGTMNNSYKFNVAEAGGYLTTGIEVLDGSLDWVAESKLIFEGSSWVRYTGTRTSSLKGPVVITLNERQEIYKVTDNLRFKLKCTVSPQIHLQDIQGRKCNILLRAYGQDFSQTRWNYTANIDEVIEITMPAEFSGFVHDGTGVMSSLLIDASLVWITPNDLPLGGAINFDTSPDKNKIYEIEIGVLVPS